MNTVQAARDAIVELSRRMRDGEITEDQFKQASLPHAAVIAEANEAAAARWREIALAIVGYAEANPEAAKAVAVGVVAGLGCWLREVDPSR